MQELHTRWMRSVPPRPVHLRRMVDESNRRPILTFILKLKIRPFEISNSVSFFANLGLIILQTRSSWGLIFVQPKFDNHIFIIFFTSDGYTYERAAIKSWMTKGKTLSPMTNAPLANHTLTPNRGLKIAIQRHLRDN